MEMVAKNPEYTSFEAVKLYPGGKDRHGQIGSSTITRIAEAAARLRGPSAKPDRSDAMRRMMTWAAFGPHPMPMDWGVNTADQVPEPVKRRRPPKKGVNRRWTDQDRVQDLVARREARRHRGTAHPEAVESEAAVTEQPAGQ
jgi:hypothetical protein